MLLVDSGVRQEIEMKPIRIIRIEHRNTNSKQHDFRRTGANLCVI